MSLVLFAMIGIYINAPAIFWVWYGLYCGWKVIALIANIIDKLS